MFKTREQLESGTGGPALGSAALSHHQALPLEPASALLQLLPEIVEAADERRVWRGLTGLWRDSGDWIAARCRVLDLTHDLAVDIGSQRWFRGFAAMLGLSAAALSFWPNFTAVEAATALPADLAARDEFSSQMIMPLALGADSGRRMGATSLVVPISAVPERPMVKLTAMFGQGDSFGRMLQRAGVGAGDAARVSGMVAGTVPLGEIGPGTQFAITLGRRSAPGIPRPLDRLDFRARFDLALVVERQGDTLALNRRPIPVDNTPLRVRGTVGTSLYYSARAAGAPVRAIQQYLHTLDQHLSLEGDIAPGDQFDIIVGYKRSAGGESETGDLLYAGLERGKQPVAQLLRWGSDGQFFEASGMGQQAATVFGPVNGRITSGYGMRRHPILGYTRMHAGVDFGAAWGSPIFAVSDGTVSFAGRHGGHGNYVRLEHGGGLGTGYGHMSRIAVYPGSRVHAGQVIGYVGSSGLSTGPHLHYEVYRGGQVVNPLSVRFSVTAQVDRKELQAFKAKMANLKAIAPGAAFKSLAFRQAEIGVPTAKATALPHK